MSGWRLLNLKALHAQICLVLKDTTDIDVIPFVNFGSEDFAFDILAYQRQNSAGNDPLPNHTLYSSISTYRR